MPILISFLGFFVVAFVAAAALTSEVAPEYDLDLELEKALDTANDPWTDSWIDAAKESEQNQETVETPGSNHHLKPEKALDTANDPWTDSWIDATKESEQNQETVETPGSNHHLKPEMTNQRAKSAPFRGVPRILGGENAYIEDFPYMVSVLEGKGILKNHMCGGSIIGSQWVLTAAHCFHPNISISEYTVRVGVTNISSSKGIDFSVSEIIPHNLCKKMGVVYDYDIAVVRINGEFNFTDYVQPIRLADCFPHHGSVATVAGWGFTNKSSRPSKTLQSLAVPILCQKTCKNLYRRYPLTPRMFCAGYIAGKKDACPKDSGGPLVFQGEQVGVVSWGIGCGNPNFPGVYANVVHLRSWISATTGI